MTLFPLEQLHSNVRAGRSLWIGMFPEPSEELLANRTKILETNADLFKESEAPGDLHVTLAHLGKNRSVKDVAATHAAVELAASLQIGDLSVQMTGVLRLKMHVVLALVPDYVIGIRSKVRASLDDRQVSFSDNYAMTPHLTIARLAYEHDLPVLPSIAERRLTFRSLTLVCADARVSVPFHE